MSSHRPWRGVAAELAALRREFHEWRQLQAAQTGDIVQGPFCEAFHTSQNGAAGNGTLVPLAWDDSRGAMADWWSAAEPTRITIGRPGWYVVAGNYSFEPNATGRRDYYLRANGTDYFAQVAVGPNADAAGGLVYRRVYLDSAEYVEMVVRQFSGGGLQGLSAPGRAFLSVEWRGP